MYMKRISVSQTAQRSIFLPVKPKSGIGIHAVLVNIQSVQLLLIRYPQPRVLSITFYTPSGFRSP